MPSQIYEWIPINFLSRFGTMESGKDTLLTLCGSYWNLMRIFAVYLFQIEFQPNYLTPWRESYLT